MYSNKVRRWDEIDQMPTVKDILEREEAWVQTHAPIDRGAKLNQFMFKAANGAVKDHTFVPFAQIIEPNPQNLPVPMQGQQQLVVTPYAMDQLLSAIKIPKDTFFRLPPTIQNMIVNWLVQNERTLDKNVLLRIIDGNSVRAIMGAIYQPIDNLEVIKALAPFCPEGTRVTCVQNDERTFHMSLILPNTRTAIRAGDEIESGFHIRNSEVGLSSVTIAAYTFRLTCSNGAIGGGDTGGFYRFRHTGDPERIRDAMKTSIESTYLEATKITEQIKSAVNVAIDKPAESLESLCRQENLTQDQYKQMLDNFFKEPDPTLYGMFNAVTATARDMDGDASYEMSRVATKLLSQGAPRVA